MGVAHSIACGYERGKDGAPPPDAKEDEAAAAEALRLAARAASKNRALEAAPEADADEEAGGGAPGASGSGAGGGGVPMEPSPRVADAGPPPGGASAKRAGPEPPSSPARPPASGALPPLSEEELLRQYEAELDAVRLAAGGGGGAAAAEERRPSAMLLSPPAAAPAASGALSELTVADDRGQAEAAMLAEEHRFRTAMLEGQRLYARPLRDPDEREFLGVSEEQVSRILLHLDTVLKVHEGLYDDLFDEELLTMPQVYARHAPYFEAFTLYAAAAGGALETLNELGANERLVQSFRLKEASTGDGSLLGLLLLPMQHLARVAATLGVLRDRAREQAEPAPDAADLEEAAGCFAAHAAAQAEALAQAERVAGVLEVRFSVGDLGEGFLSARRHYVRRAPLTAWRLVDGFHESSKHTFYLFNDTLLWTNAKTALEGQLDFCERPLAARASDSHATRVDVLEAGDGGAVVVSLECADEEERNDWLRDLGAAFAELARQQN